MISIAALQTPPSPEWFDQLGPAAAKHLREIDSRPRSIDIDRLMQYLCQQTAEVTWLRERADELAAAWECECGDLGVDSICPLCMYQNAADR